MLHLFQILLGKLVASTKHIYDLLIVTRVDNLSLWYAVNDLIDAPWVVAERIRAWDIVCILTTHDRDRNNL